MSTKYDLTLPADILADQVLAEVLRENPDLAERLAGATEAHAKAKALVDEIGGFRRDMRNAWVVTRAPEDRQALRIAIREADGASAVLTQAEEALEAVQAEIAPLLRERLRAVDVQLRAEVEAVEDEIKRLERVEKPAAERLRRTWGQVDSQLQRRGFVPLQPSATPQRVGAPRPVREPQPSPDVSEQIPVYFAGTKWGM